jgi:hypothetical protein
MRGMMNRTYRKSLLVSSNDMTSRVIKSFAVVPTVISASLVFFGTGCGGESAPTAAPSASGGGEASTPKAPPQKKGGVLVESEENTPARFKDRDN